MVVGWVNKVMLVGEIVKEVWEDVIKRLKVFVECY